MGEELRGFMQNNQTTPQNKHFSILEFTVLCSSLQAEVLTISEVAKNLRIEKMHKVLLCWLIVKQLSNHS